MRGSEYEKRKKHGDGVRSFEMVDMQRGVGECGQGLNRADMRPEMIQYAIRNIA